MIIEEHTNFFKNDYLIRFQCVFSAIYRSSFYLSIFKKIHQ